MRPPCSLATVGLRAAFVLAAAGLAAASAAAADLTLSIRIDPRLDRAPISPYIYGSSQDLPSAPLTVRRMGGNRITGYNWETNASNAGSDWYHSSDGYLVSNLPAELRSVPGITITNFHDRSLASGVPYSIVTLPMAGYVALDQSGSVSVAEAAPSPRWAEVRHTKGSALLTTPDTTDGYVYTDELLHFLLTRYGPASSARGIRGYAFDNEPDLWAATHARLHPSKLTCTELIARSTELGRTIKRMDPSAETLGFVSYGFGGFRDLQGAPDWATERAKGAGRYRWFIDYYLDQMRQASATAGLRLVDVLDLHNYSEHSAGGYRVSETTDYSNIACNQGRMQAPRGLWDPTFVENSWIGQWFADFLPYLPQLRTSIDTFYPGTKLAFTEYNAGGEGHISGGIAQADYLGLYGKYGVYLATFWQLHPEAAYAAAAFRLYRNYDGLGSTYGDTTVSAQASDTVNASAYAALDSHDEAKLHLVVLNKNYDSSTTTTIEIAGPRTYTSARVFAFDSASATITERTPIPSIAANRFTLNLPALTAAHVVLSSPDQAPVIATQNHPSSRSFSLGQTATLDVIATGTGPLSYQWYRGGAPVAGATTATLSLSPLIPADAGLYDVVVSGVDDVLSRPAVLGVLPASGERTAGAITTRAEWQDIHHPNGAVYDQFLLTGAAGTFTADFGQIARCSYLDPNNSIVQVEMSGAGAITIVLDPTTVAGPMAPALYNQGGIDYMKGKATVILAGADSTTHFTIYSVGTANNPGVTRPDTTYVGWADIAVSGIVSTYDDGAIGSIHQGNVSYSATTGYTGIYAPHTMIGASTVVLHDIAASGLAEPYLYFGDTIRGLRTSPGNALFDAGTAQGQEEAGSRIASGDIALNGFSIGDPGNPVSSGAATIAGGALAQPNGRFIAVGGLSRVIMGAGQDSCGRAAPAQVIQTRLISDIGTDLTPAIVTGP
ncbi:MAG: hypothetical protein IPL39_07740 [Opitutaceae bacterium]|nr:hypothetical protein [Opitutaceae bacterium]